MLEGVPVEVIVMSLVILLGVLVAVATAMEETAKKTLAAVEAAVLARHQALVGPVLQVVQVLYVSVRRNSCRSCLTSNATKQTA